jgi:hypothetical protein
MFKSRLWRLLTFGFVSPAATAYLWVADSRQVTLVSDHPWSSPFGQPSAIQIRSRRICLCPDKDNFAGSKIGRASARPQGPRHGWRGPKVTKRNPPRSLRRAHYARYPARLAAAGRSPNSPGAEQRASGSIRSLATTPGLARCSARSDGGLSNPSQSGTRRCFQDPWVGDGASQIQIMRAKPAQPISTIRVVRGIV